MWRNRLTKFGNRPARCSQGVMHQSTAESRRCTELHALQSAGLISDLKAHPQERFDLSVNGKHVCFYLADFVYFDDNGKQIVEDVKGFRKADYILKAKLFEAVFGFPITEVRTRR